MPLLQKSDLVHEYAWTIFPDNDPRMSGEPDTMFLNRHEGHEVLAFINRFAIRYKLEKLSSGLKVERFIHSYLPGYARSHKDVRRWIASHWKNSPDETPAEESAPEKTAAK